MTLNERILDFLDGSLPADEEAELLHTLSVSPEKRGVLRDFMEQRALFAHDGKTLSVPYEAEQRLWTRLDMIAHDQVMPAEEFAGEASRTEPVLLPVEAPEGGFFASTIRGARTMASALTLFAGIGIGYFAGTHTTTASNPLAKASSSPAPTVSAASTITTFRGNRRIVHSTSHASLVPRLAALPAPEIMIPSLTDESHGSYPPIGTSLREPMITRIPARSMPAIAMTDIGGDSGGITPRFHQIRTSREARTASFLDRFEFRVNESIGREFPNTIATNISQPFITNTSASAFFQVLPHSNVLWAGAGYGTANVTEKQLYVAPGDPMDPSQQVLAADTAHAQTGYVAGMVELRLPAFTNSLGGDVADLTFDAGYGVASLGRMMFGEVGLHYNITEEVGAICGVRLLQFRYDLSSQKAAAIQSGASGLAISNAVAAAGPSFNTELNAGLFFHF
ncbi:MAG TPA: hypothetical protein VFH95_03525 [Candidatus Kapabacteria bacterium]|nr:hypothetical protein [Candidatus Kapabacteria bacterium]